MYIKTENDIVKALREFPSPAAGATEPVVISNEHQMVLAYRVAESDREWTAENAVHLGGPEEENLWAIIHFRDIRPEIENPAGALR